MVVDLSKKIALLSNINMNFIIRSLKKGFEVYDTEGYGNELGVMLDRTSAYHAFGPDIAFLIMDLMELLEHDLTVDGARMDRWFAMLEAGLQPGTVYFVSDAWLWGPELGAMFDGDRKRTLEGLWQERLDRLCREHPNVYSFPYRRLVEELGEENAFSLKTWYLGGILHSSAAQKRIGELIAHKVQLLERTPKKALLLDLDNTLWGGLAGEADHTPVILSGEHSGLAYKNLQRVIYRMQEQGVLLGIVSKNNERDAMELLERHPHMVLKPELFAARRINWEPKHENILAIARELNLGTDSFVFWDDNPAERELVKRMLPEVAVPDFPDRPEELASAMVGIYRQYFEKAAVTREDLKKTEQYSANVRRESLRSGAGSFEDYLKQLDIVVTRVEAAGHLPRLAQLLGKTNQFNLTVWRPDQAELGRLLERKDFMAYVYRVADCFGDSGIVAAALVNLAGEPKVENFVMSCRVMGKNIEYAVMEDVENDLRGKGYGTLGAYYRPSARNKPVENLFERLGYQADIQEDGTKEYKIDIADRPRRVYYAKIKKE